MKQNKIINLLVKTANKLDNLDPKLADELDALISKLASDDGEDEFEEEDGDEE